MASGIFFLNKRNFSGSKQVLTSGSTEYISAFFLSSFGHWKATDILSVVHSAKSSCVSQVFLCKSSCASALVNLQISTDKLIFSVKISKNSRPFFWGGGPC